MIECPHCKTNEVVKRGYIQTATRGKQQRYFCKKCEKKFIIRDGFYRMRNTPKKITLCIDLFYRGISTRKIQEHLQAFYPHNSSNVSIYNWVVKYSKMISRFTDKLPLEVGSELQMDEMEYKAKGLPCWFIDSIDPDTRFMVASKMVTSRNYAELKDVMMHAKARTQGRISVVTTDGLSHYDHLVSDVFYDKHKTMDNSVKHNKKNARRGEGFNYPIERMHNSIRQRTMTFRGFHGSIQSAWAIMKGYEIFYNFIRTHQAIGCCPCELAVPSLKLDEGNKWLELILMNCKNI